MIWITRAIPPAHLCRPPSTGGHIVRPLGWLGDLWRCDTCRMLWRVADACDTCDRYGHRPHHGQHAVGVIWRPARMVQRLRHSAMFTRGHRV